MVFLLLPIDNFPTLLYPYPMKNRSETAMEGIRYAYCLGYRTTIDGELYSHRGKRLKVRLCKNHRYPYFTLNGFARYPMRISIHTFAAYCFYGEEAFKHQCVRHLDGNVLNFSKQNIALGTYSDNEADKTLQNKQNAVLNRLSNDMVRNIRRLDSLGNSRTKISETTGVDFRAVQRILNGERYTNIA